MANPVPYFTISDFYKPVILYNKPFDMDGALNQAYNPVSVKIVKAYEKDVPSLTDLNEDELYAYWYGSLAISLFDALKHELRKESGLNLAISTIKKNEKLASLLDIQNLEHPELWISNFKTKKGNALFENLKDALQGIDCYLDRESKWVVLSYKNIHERKLAETLLHFLRDMTYTFTNIHMKVFLEESFYDSLTFNFPRVEEFYNDRSVVRLKNCI
jgi:hypothetical protein